MKKIILASASPRRKELLEKAGVSFEILPSDVQENTVSETPQEMVKELSFIKAEATQVLVNKKENFGENHVIIGADTIVVLDDKVLGKPKNEAHAFEMLMALQGRSHQVYTGVTLLWKKSGEWVRHSFAECTEVMLYPLSEEEVRAYLATGEPMDKAGAYAIQGSFFVYVKGISGDYSNVVGLPVARLFYEAKKQGIDLKG